LDLFSLSWRHPNICGPAGEGEIFQFSQDIGEWPENQIQNLILIPDWTNFSGL